METGGNISDLSIYICTIYLLNVMNITGVGVGDGGGDGGIGKLKCF